MEESSRSKESVRLESCEDDQYSESKSMRFFSPFPSELAYSSISCLAFSSDLGLNVLLRSRAPGLPGGTLEFLSSYRKQAFTHLR
ncbi:hypothetical protein ACHQM5_028815 [Ranunculus cassubicifolius]